MDTIRMELLKEDIKGHREIAYSLLQAKVPYFLEVSVHETEDVLLVESHLAEGMYDWFNLEGMIEVEKLRHLLSLGAIYDALKTAKYSYQWSPEAVVFTMNGLPLFKHRGIKDQVPPYHSPNEQEFLTAYKAMIVSLLDPKISYKNLIEGQLAFYRGYVFCEEVIKADTLSRVLSLVSDKYVYEQERNRKQYTRISYAKRQWLKIATMISGGLAVVTLAVLFYVSTFALPKQQMISALRLAFIQQDYSKVVTTIKNQDSRSFEADDRYIIAYAVIMTEPLTEAQKHELTKITVQSNADYLRYWIVIGQARIDEAIDIASFLDDPQLLMYGMTKKIDEIQRAPHMNSDERTEKINGYKTKLDELKKTFLEPSKSKGE